MNRTVTALFDTREDAEAGRQRLIVARVHADNVRILDKSSEGFKEQGYSTTEKTEHATGLWSGSKNAFLPDEDRFTFEEGVRRGGYVLSADVDEDQVDDAVAALEATKCVDIEDRSKSWRNEGWTVPKTAVPPAGADWDGKPVAQGSKPNEEQLVVGKRETERGGVRVRSYVTEKPIHEQVRSNERK